MQQLIGATRLFTGDEVIADGGVLWEDDRVLAVGDFAALCKAWPAAASVFHTGCTLLPGLIDAHTHLVMPGTGEGMLQWGAMSDATLLLIALQNCDLALRAGVTTVVDLGARGTLTFDLRAALHAVGRSAPRLLLCGRAITITGGHAWPWHGEADGEDEVRRMVRELCKQGADIIKFMASGGGTPNTDGKRPSYTQREMDALVDEAHRRNRRVFAHCTCSAAIDMALRAGVDVIAHCQFFAPDGSFVFNESIADQMLAAGTFVNPTLQINRVLSGERVNRATMPPEVRARHDAWTARYPDFADTVARLHVRGIPMVCGTDCGWGYSPFNELHLELDALVQAGLSPLDALRSATTVAAQALGMEMQIGALQRGLAADLLLVTGDATQNVLDVANVREVWIAGRPVPL